MERTYKKTGELLKLVLKTDKADSAFTYFTLEACDNLTFHSTLPHQEGDTHRLIEVFTPIEWKEELEKVLAGLQKQFAIEIVSEEILLDG